MLLGTVTITRQDDGSSSIYSFTLLNFFTMQTIAFSVGVDISNLMFDATIERLHADRSTLILGRRKFKNNKTGFKLFVKWVNRKTNQKELVHIGMEATGRYYENLAYFLLAQQYRVSVILPNKIKHFAYSRNQYSKTDKLDASLIASYVSREVPKPWQPLSPLMRQLRELSRERQALVAMRTQSKNRLTALEGGHKPLRDTIKRLRKQILFFNRQIEQIEVEMDALRKDDEQLSRSFNLLTSIPFIASITAYTILSETDGFVLFESREQLIKYAGLDIIEKQSGTSVRGKSQISKRGNAHLRSAPYPGLGTVATANNVFGETYRTAIGKGAEKKQARTAALRQLLKVAFGVHKSGKPYCEAVHRNRIPKRVGELEGSPTVTALVA